MLPANVGRSDFPTLTTNTDQNTRVDSPTNGTESSPKNYFSDPDPNGLSDPTSLTERTCRLSISDQAANDSLPSREQLGGKGMFLQRMAAINLPVPPFKCVSARVMNALEQHPLDSHRLARYLPVIVLELEAECSLIKIREYLNTSPPLEKNKMDKWLEGLTQFIVSSDFYEQVKDSEAACHIRNLRCQLEEQSTSQPVIVRSSGINEDNYGDAQAGKYLSLVQGEDDVLRTCLKVMASAYRPAVCSEGIPQTMALIIQHCVDCRYGGVAMSFQSFQDDT
ncbi:PEP/pyruvate-binding domain-containing protein, partial [Endozoicomonas sp. SESOKO2]|uniref:PEP/pyruvate-binding domain-containing protein n=1 Tax=Endozoicomonas sp. SESOKO2 TaxID=2828743 RepID=UPI0021478103